MAAKNRNLESRAEKTALFIQCITDRFAPKIAVATLRLLQAAGANVEVPLAQHCCGLPAIDIGNLEVARKMALDTIDALEGYEYVVTPAPSCAVAMGHEYERLFQDNSHNKQRAHLLAARVTDLVSYLADCETAEMAKTGGKSERDSDTPSREGVSDAKNSDQSAITVHPFCQSRTRLGHTTATTARLISRLCGTTPIPLPEADVCCGFGGLSSLTSPEVAKAILARKLRNTASTGATTLITDNPGCTLHLQGGTHASSQNLKVLHIAEYLAARL